MTSIPLQTNVWLVHDLALFNRSQVFKAEIPFTVADLDLECEHLHIDENSSDLTLKCFHWNVAIVKLQTNKSNESKQSLRRYL